MRVVVGVTEDAADWLPAEMSPSEVSGLCEALFNDMIIAGHADQLSALVRQTAAVTLTRTTGQWRSRLADIAARCPATQRTGSPPVDLRIEDCTAEGLNADLVDVQASVRYVNLRMQRTQTFPRGTPRQDVFDQYIRPLACASIAVHVCDQYALKNIANGYGAGAIWLMEQLIRCGVRSIALYSLAPDLHDTEWCADQVRRNLQVALAAPLLAQSPAVQVHLFSRSWNWSPRPTGQGSPKHRDRHIRFRVSNDGGRTTPVIVLGPGLDGFQHSTVAEAFTVHEEPDSVGAQDRERDYAKSGVPVVSRTLA